MNVFVEENSLQAIANGIRYQNGGADTYTPGQMAQAIDNLNPGGGGALISKTVTTAGTCYAEDDGADGYSQVVNNIPWYIVPYAFDLHPKGYVMNNKWSVNGATVNYSDVYQVQANHTYYLTLGDTRGSRWRGLIVTTDPTPMDRELTGVTSQFVNVSNPAARANVTFTSPVDGYMIITKDNAGMANIPTYLFDITVQ